MTALGRQIDRATATISSASGFTAIGGLKWEDQSVTTTSYTDQTVATTTWTDQSPDSTTWNEAA